MKENKNVQSKSANDEIMKHIVAKKFREDKEFRTKVIPNKKKDYKEDLKEWLKSWPDY